MAIDPRTGEIIFRPREGLLPKRELLRVDAQLTALDKIMAQLRQTKPSRAAEPQVQAAFAEVERSYEVVRRAVEKWRAIVS